MGGNGSAFSNSSSLSDRSLITFAFSSRVASSSFIAFSVRTPTGVSVGGGGFSMVPCGGLLLLGLSGWVEGSCCPKLGLRRRGGHVPFGQRKMANSAMVPRVA